MFKTLIAPTLIAIIAGVVILRSFSANLRAVDLGDLVIVGDSITQGGKGHPSYRYELFKHLVDSGVTYNFVGSVTGAYAFSTGATPDYLGQTFDNVHDGHFGWRAYWENGRVPLPTGRVSNNRGTGTVENWTGQTTQYEFGSAGNFVTYSGPTYTPDTVIAMIGINDLGDSTPATLLSDIELLVQQYQAANPNVDIYLTSVLTVNNDPKRNANVAIYNLLLNAAAPGWSTGTSTVSFIDVTTGFNASTMTYDNTHPNLAGEQFVADRIALALALLSEPLSGDVNLDGMLDQLDVDAMIAGRVVQKVVSPEK